MLMIMEGGRTADDHKAGDIGGIPGCGGELDTIGASLDLLARDIELGVDHTGEEEAPAATAASEKTRHEMPTAHLPLNGELHNHNRSERLGSWADSEIARSTTTRDGRIMPRLRRNLRGGYCVILCALGMFLLVALILGLAIYFAGHYHGETEPRTYPRAPGRRVEVRGYVEVVGGPFATYSRALQDGASLEYAYTVTSFTFLVDNLFMTNDLFRDIYSGTKVSKISNGSLEIQFTIVMETSVSPTYNLVDDMTHTFMSSIGDNNNFGVFIVDPASFLLYVKDDVFSPTPPNIPSTCEVTLLPMCQVYNNRSSYPSLLGHVNQEAAIRAGLGHLAVLESDCHEFIQLFWCSLFMPSCDEGTFRPCKEFCLEIVSHCPAAKDIISLLPGRGCSSLPSKDKDGKCLSKPTPERPVCQPVTHDFCPEMYGGRQTVMPNLLGHQSQDWAGRFLQGDVKQLDRLSCSPHVRLFGCALLNPPCANERDGVSAVPPCRELCTLVQDHCRFFMELIDAEWIADVNCSQFPAFSAGADRLNTNRCLGGREALFLGNQEYADCEGHRCDGGRCVPREWTCDGTVDCEDQTDERHCAVCKGSRRSFRCRSGLCLHRNQVCNGHTDCPGGEDESDCVRLEGRRGIRGILKAYHGRDGRWKPVCDADWTEKNSNAVCHRLVGGTADITDHSHINRSDFLSLATRTDNSLSVTVNECPKQEAVEIACHLNECGLLVVPFPSNTDTPEVTIPHEVPWLVSLHGGLRGTFYCGGTLISELWVLTAAHCLHGLSDSMLATLRIRSGSSRRESASASYQETLANRIAIHPNYDSQNLTDDVALVRLSTPFRWDRHTRPGCLPSRDFSPGEDSKCFLSGWGKVTTENDKHYRRQAEVRRLHLVDRAECRQRIEKKYPHYPQQVGEHALCASGCDGLDTCSGDSGSGLTCWDPGSAKWVTTGVMSWGITGECGNSYLPGVYPRVTHYLEWIYYTIGS